MLAESEPVSSASRDRAIEIWSTKRAILVKSLEAAAVPEYVAWIDLMGARGWMAGSIRRAAETIALIHIAGHQAARKGKVKVYPVIDGIYLIGKEKRQFRAAAGLVMRTLAETFLSQSKHDRHFLVRGGIAYGRVLHGNEIAKTHQELKGDQSYSNCLALGIAIGQAYEAEKKAPPFGFYVDHTARSTASGGSAPYISSFSRWWNTRTEAAAAKDFGLKVQEYFEYLKSRRRELEYPEDRLKEHQELAKEYFEPINFATTYKSDV